MRKTKTYTRDGRAPEPSSEAISRVMSANKAKNTQPELALRKALFQNKILGYRLHYKKVPGRPDIAFVRQRLAVFVNGCYWHRCERCNYKLPKSNSDFWRQKFEKNVERDRNKQRLLEAAGWQVLVVWECQVNNEIEQQVKRINEARLINIKAN